MYTHYTGRKLGRDISAVNVASRQNVFFEWPLITMFENQGSIYNDTE